MTIPRRERLHGFLRVLTLKPRVKKAEHALHNGAAQIHMDIRFVSSLTIDDENRFAPALLQAIAALLRTSPLAYTIRIETTGGEVFEHQQAPSLPADTAVAAEFAAGRYDGEKNRPHRSLSARRPDRFVVPFGKT